MPFLTGNRWFPGKKGTVQGAIISGMGASAFLFNMVATKFINPDGVDSVGGAFPSEITARWPSLLRTLGVVYIFLSLGGALLQNNPPSHDVTYPVPSAFKRLVTGAHAPEPKKSPSRKGKAAVTPPSRSVLEDVFSKKFALLWIMILTSAVSGLNIAGSYKTYGTKQPQLNSDSYLSLVGSLAAIGGNAAGRFFWGSLSDRLGFKPCFLMLATLQSLTMFFYRALAATRLTFAIATVVMLFCMGGNFAMFPAQTFRMFGANGPSVYSFLFTGFGCAALLGPVLSNKLLQRGGYALVYTALSLLSLFSLSLAAIAI